MKKILIIGCGDIALRVAKLHAKRYQFFGLIRNEAHRQDLRLAGIRPIFGDLDQPRSLHKIAGLADTVLHFAPPSASGEQDQRTRHLLATLSLKRLPKRLIYISTSGVYGDCAGAIVHETTPVNPQSARAKRRVDAEQSIRDWAIRQHIQVQILRVPGIFSADRLPLDRLQAGSPALISTQDSYTNHIHADDLASIVWATFRRGQPNRIYHASDNDEQKMGDYFDQIADAYHLPHPTRLPRSEVAQAVSPMMWSFMNESRRLNNHRLCTELNYQLRYPTIADFLAEQFS